MLVNLYSSKTPIAVFSLPILIGILTVPIFFVPQDSIHHFWDWQNLLSRTIKQYQLADYGLTVGFVSISAHQINRVYNRHSFYSKVTFLPGLIYVVALFSLNQLNFSPVLIAHLFMIFALGQFLRLRRQEGAKTIMFWGAFFTGCSFIFSAFSVALIILPWICLAIFRPFVWREWFLVILGILIPVFYYMAILFMIKGDFYFTIASPVVKEAFKTELIEASTFGFFGLVLIASVYKYIGIMRGEINRFKKQSLVLFHFLWLSATTWFVGYYFFDHIYLSFLIPIAMLIGTSFLHAKRSNIPNLVVIIWLIISAANIFFVR